MTEQPKREYELASIYLVPDEENDVDLYLESRLAPFLNEYPELCEKLDELQSIVEICVEDYAKKFLISDEEVRDETNCD